MENIIKKMIGNLIGSPVIHGIYEQIIYVYDLHYFNNMNTFEEMIISITQEEYLKNQFFRGLFSFMLSYLSVCKTIDDQPPLRWLSLSIEKSYEHFVSRY